MANEIDESGPDTVGHWAKRCHQSARAVMENALRPYELGSTQWYVLHHLAANGPTMQRDLIKAMQVERATLSIIVRALVGKGLIAQSADTTDQRQKRLALTRTGNALWKKLPDLTFIRDVAFGGISDADKTTAAQVLRQATLQLEALLPGRSV